ncbi:50S ribosomal protein L24 [Pediococcus pentosaceus]|uniref:50S ribosomal protein L24 n=1 Tax=Pediococcus pentosaceus TaxID=1255 RepID=A0A1Y0VP43_PEDPE|nr:50S ribosomal protein L24 [Pediococcus pentosaceus]
MFVKVGDKVRVISGKDKGKEGTIKQTLAKRTVLLLKALT